MDKYPKTDSEFEALFELVYKKKVDASQFNGLQKKAIYDRMRSKSYGARIRNKGIENSLAKPSIKTRLYLGKTAGGKKVYFNVEFSKNEIKCSSTIDLGEVGRQIDSFQADIQTPLLERTFPGVFIRAPKFNSDVSAEDIVAICEGEVVGVRKGNRLALTFHPELSEDVGFHRWLIERASTIVEAKNVS